MTGGLSNVVELSKMAENHASYLKDQSHRCLRLARACADQKICHALETMGVEFLERAAAIEEKNFQKKMTLHPAHSRAVGRSSNRTKHDARIVRKSTITCPRCAHRATERMPESACQFFYDCKGCGERLKPLAGHCCVFCSYGSVPCPPKQQPDPSCCN